MGREGKGVSRKGRELVGREGKGVSGKEGKGRELV